MASFANTKSAFDDAPAGGGRKLLSLVSIGAHAAALVGLFVYSIIHVEEIAPPTVTLTFLSAAPPPPPPPPPPAGSSKPKTTPTKPVEVKPTESKVVEVTDKKPTPKEPEPEVAGGQEGGVKGGVAGGVVGGVVGGVLGGTGTGEAPKMVPSFTLAAQQLTHPDPRLPDWYLNQHAAQTVKGTYKVCIGLDGRIASVTTMVGIGGVDDIVTEHIRKEWTYKPQAVPVCTASVVIFKIK